MFRLTYLKFVVRWSQAVASAAVLALVASTATTAFAEIHWHADLQTARAAATVSQKPVLAIFTASWSPEAVRFTERTLTSPEVAALVSACYEPVLIDVDTQAAVTKRMQVVHVPAACILAPGGGRLATFECPEAPADFVAAAARAAQNAAARPIGEPEDSLAGDLTGPTQVPAGPASRSGNEIMAPPGGGAIALVTTKVNQLSDFAAVGEVAPPVLPQASMAPSNSPVSRFGSATATDTPASRFGSATVTDAPVVPTRPSTWPGEQPAQASSFTNATPQPQPVRPGIEPATTTSPTPWLSAPTAAAPAPAGPSASASASDLPEKPAATSSWSSFVAAFQKPFSIFSTKPAKAAAPPTMPPARPASPLAMATAAIAPATAVQQAPAADPYGSMPLGLEGYCPVTLAERGVWTEGRAQWGVRHRGRTYLFAGPEQQQAFLTNPDRFSPALSGDDPVLAIEKGKSLPGRRAYGVTYQSRIYLFASAENRAAFTANPERFTATVTLAERPAPVDAIRRF